MTGPKDTAFLFGLWVRRGKASSMQASWPRNSSEQKGEQWLQTQREDGLSLTRLTPQSTTGTSNTSHFTEKVCLPFDTQRRVEPKREGERLASHKLTRFQKPFIWTVHSREQSALLAFVLPSRSPALETQNCIAAT